MWIIKIIILSLIFLISSQIGRIIAGKYKYRLEELKEIKNALNIFKTKIKYTYEPIPEIFEEISKNTEKNIANIFLFAKSQMKNKTAGNAWKDAIYQCSSNLNDEDKNTLNILSKMLGESDIEGQISQIDITQEFLSKQIQYAEEEKNKNEKLYKKLGTIMGLGIVVILI